MIGQLHGQSAKVGTCFRVLPQHDIRTLLLALALGSAMAPITSQGEGSPANPRNAGASLESGPFIQIPGPNPVLVPGDKGAWDDNVIEASDAFNDSGTYYFYYHGTGGGKGYRLGVATSKHPLGPFKKHGDKPILGLGPPGSWDDLHVACAMVLKEGTDKYYMWYSGLGRSREHRKWIIGLATASHPLGPNTATELEDSPPVCLSNVKTVAMTVECRSSPKATRELRLHIRSSHDGVHYDTKELLTFDHGVRPGETSRRTYEIDTAARFLKVFVSNLGESEAVSDLKVTATLGG